MSEIFFSCSFCDKLSNFFFSESDIEESFNLMKGNNKNFNYKYIHTKLGNNYRLTEIQSAIGRIQIKRLSEWHEKRKNNANILKTNLENISSLRIPIPSEDKEHAWYKFYAYIDNSALSDGCSRDRIINEINKYGYPAFSGSCSEIYLEKCFKDSRFALNKRLPIARELGETSLMLLIHPTITKDQIFNYLEIVKLVINQAVK